MKRIIYLCVLTMPLSFSGMEIESIERTPLLQATIRNYTLEKDIEAQRVAPVPVPIHAKDLLASLPTEIHEMIIRNIDIYGDAHMYLLKKLWIKECEADFHFERSLAEQADLAYDNGLPIALQDAHKRYLAKIQQAVKQVKNNNWNAVRAFLAAEIEQLSMLKGITRGSLGRFQRSWLHNKMNYTKHIISELKKPIEKEQKKRECLSDCQSNCSCCLAIGVSSGCVLAIVANPWLWSGTANFNFLNCTFSYYYMGLENFTTRYYTQCCQFLNISNPCNLTQNEAFICRGNYPSYVCTALQNQTDKEYKELWSHRQVNYYTIIGAVLPVLLLTPLVAYWMFLRIFKSLRNYNQELIDLLNEYDEEADRIHTLISDQPSNHITS